MLIVKKLNRANLRKAFDEAIVKEMRNAARAWLRATYAKVPVYTGEARASLTPLGEFLGVDIPIERSPEADLHGHRNRGEWTGRNLGHYTFVMEKDKYYFTFSTDVRHYIYNEQNVAPFLLTQPTPWYSFEDGKRAFQDYIRLHLIPSLPKIKDFDDDFPVYEE